MKYSVILTLAAGFVAGQVYDDSQRPQVCERNEATCQTQCDIRKKSVKTNTCDPDTFNFSCSCSDNYIPNPANVTFPAALATCQIQGVQCANQCSTADVTCAQACVQKYVCNGSGDSTDTAVALPTNISDQPTSSKPSIYDSSLGHATRASYLLSFAIATILISS